MGPLAGRRRPLIAAFARANHEIARRQKMTSIEWLPTRRRMLLGAAALLCALATQGTALGHDNDGGGNWVGTWTASPQPPEPPFVLPVPAQFDNQTVRQIVHTSIGGKLVRV